MHLSAGFVDIGTLSKPIVGRRVLSSSGLHGRRRPPRWNGEDQSMVRVMITCPKTGKAVPSGFGFGDLASFDSARLIGNYVQCTDCGEMHLVDNETIMAFPSGDLESG